MGEFTGRTALVTGGSRGIGRAIALRLAAGGARVAINYHTREDAARAVRHEIEAAGGACLTLRADVSDPGSVASMVRACESDLGPIDLLALSAGVAEAATHEDLDYAAWRRIMAVNADGVFLPVMAVKDGMLARGFGRIVALSSVAGLRPRPQQIAYGAAKAAVNAFVRNMAAGLAPTVRINAIAPGLIDTEMGRSMGEEVAARLVAATPMARLGRPEEIAEYAAFLLSERASFTTGQTVVASGGRVTLP